MSSRSSYTTAMPGSLPPPVDLATYARSMHQHTKRQMEAANMPTSRRNGRTSRAHFPSMPNGVSSSSSTSSRTPEVEYH
ncbi:hypothetical protein F4821DRAFT_227882, partial [Hypoxylon rubiginosum]